MTGDVTQLIMIILVIVIVFIFIRELVCWYFKISKQVKLQQAMLETLLKMYERDGGEVNWEIVNKTLLK